MSEHDETQHQDTQFDPLATAEDAPPEDPFAEVGADLPPGVEPGTLGGVNPSEEAERLAEEGAVPEEEVGPGPGDELPEDEEPLAPADAGLGDEVAPPAEEDPLVVDGVQYEEGEEAAMAAADLGQEPETDQEDLTAHNTGGQDNRTPVGGSETGSQSQEKSEPVELLPGQRQYTILRFYGEAKDEHGVLWEEALDEPIIARSGELALRRAYRTLSGNSAGSFTLVPVPTKYWNPEEVEGAVPDRSLSIKVGKKK